MSPTSSTTAVTTATRMNGTHRSKTMEIEPGPVEVVLSNLPTAFNEDMLKGLLLFTRGLVKVQMDSKQHTMKGPVASAFYETKEDAESAVKSVTENQEKSGSSLNLNIYIWALQNENQIAGSDSYTTSDDRSFFSSPDHQAAQRAVLTQRDQMRGFNGNAHTESTSPAGSGSSNEKANLTLNPTALAMSPQLLQHQQQLMMASQARFQQFLPQQLAMSNTYPPNWTANPAQNTAMNAPKATLRSIPIAAHLDRLVPETIEPRNPPSRWYPGWDPPRKVVPPDNPKDNHPPSKTLYVGNLPRETTEAEIFDIFYTQPGYVKMLFVVKAAGPMCFVEFENVHYATIALNRTNGTVLADTDFSRGGMRLSFSKNHINQRDVPSAVANPYVTSAETVDAAMLRSYYQQQAAVSAYSTNTSSSSDRTVREYNALLNSSGQVQSPQQTGFNYSFSPTAIQPVGMTNNVNMVSAQYQMRQPMGTSTDSVSSDTHTITASFYENGVTPRPESAISLNMSLDNGLPGLSGMESSRWMMPSNVQQTGRQAQGQGQMSMNTSTGMNNGTTNRFEKRTGSLAPGTPWNNINPSIWATGPSTSNANGNGTSTTGSQ